MKHMKPYYERKYAEHMENTNDLTRLMERMDYEDARLLLKHRGVNDLRLQGRSNIFGTLIQRKQTKLKTLEERYFNNNWWRNRKNALKRYYANMPGVVVITCGLGISPRISGPIAMLPENLDIDRLISVFPPKNTDYFVVDDRGEVVSCNSANTKNRGIIFDKERLIYLLGLLSKIPANNPDSINQEGWVRINSVIIRSYFNDYLAYINYLIFTGVIERSPNYVRGEHSYGYRYTEEYANKPLKRYIYCYTRALLEQRNQKFSRSHHFCDPFEECNNGVSHFATPINGKAINEKKQ